MLSLGIDSDATAWRIAAWDEDRAADLQTFAQVDELWDFVEDLISLHPAMPIVLPSGFGIPVTRAGEILDQDIVEMTLQPSRPIADKLGKFLAEARRRPLRAFCIPGVKLLPTVPPHRKVNRLDLGTSDALCAAAWAIHCLEATGRAHAACDFLLLHTRIDSRSLLVVQGGRIVDGMGTTTDQTGVAREGVLAPLASHPGGTPSPRRMHDARSEPPDCGQAALWETVEKESLGLLGFHKLSEVIPTGVRRVEFSQALEGRLPLVQLPAPPDGYEAALGAAVIAAGLTGGPSARLVEHLGLWEARERVLDWITE
ncbi:MAG: DUF1464 family protein [Candidatus Methylomirabilales bacterium]